MERNKKSLEVQTREGFLLYIEQFKNYAGQLDLPQAQRFVNPEPLAKTLSSIDLFSVS